MSRKLRAPRDMVGRPIMIGDIMSLPAGPHVKVVGIGDDSFFYGSRDIPTYMECRSPRSTRHACDQDTWHEIINDAFDCGYRNPSDYAMKQKLIERCRKLARDQDWDDDDE